MEIPGDMRDPTLAVLLTPDPVSGTEVSEPPKPVVTVDLDGAAGLVSSGEQEGKSHWYLTILPSGVRSANVIVSPGKDAAGWKGKAYAWLLAGRERQMGTVSVEIAGTATPRPMPPLVRDASIERVQVNMGELAITSGVIDRAGR